ncbi:hypothetical protein [Bacillus sp. FJAT-47783]|uniref:hypothetical protein n=1 Tax=Bacillus sp. FJAT-47783 TaxID=2922712 RepID=UPI001FABE8E7|nr:hypothetical protein [Bacillus sp. FJAT-47783]
MEESKNLYKEGHYRFWLNTERGYLRLKLDGSNELYTIPKDSPLYNRLMEDLFGKHSKKDKE